MERRQHPRVQLPLLVEVQHPTLGRQNCVARDVSQGGVYVQLRTSGISPGAKVRLTLQSPSSIDSQPTPTVQMEVVRVEEEGLGLKFVNNTSRHLWESVERLRDELAIGRDYFQLHVCALAMQRKGRLLVVQQNGRWTFPGTYLIVGDQWRNALERMLTDRFSVAVTRESMEVLAFETESSERVPEAAVAKAFAVMQVDAGQYEFSPGERYKAARWLQNPRMIDELTFVDDLTRDQAAAAFRWFARG